MRKLLKRCVNAVLSAVNGQGPVKDNYIAKMSVFGILMLYFALSATPSTNTAGHFTVCLFHNITGYPCPACGTIRGLKYFFHLQFVDSIMMNPLAAIVALYMIVGIVWMAADLWRGKESYFEAIHRKTHWSVILIFVILTLANWYWNFQKGL